MGGPVPLRGEERGGSEKAAGVFQRNSYAGSRLVAGRRWRVPCFPYRVDHSPQRSIEWRRLAIGLLRLAGTTYGAIHSRRAYASSTGANRRRRLGCRGIATQGASQALGVLGGAREGAHTCNPVRCQAAICIVALVEIAFRRPIWSVDRSSRCSSSLPKLLSLHGLNLLLVDLFSPGSHDPHGMHGSLWEPLRRR